MQCVRASRLFVILLSGCALALLPSCDEAADRGDPGAVPDAGVPDASPPDGEGGEPLPVGEGCFLRDAGGGFASVPLGPASTLLTAQLEARVSSLGVEGVIGLAHGAVTRAGELAAAVRFAPSGVLEVRDGAGYRADVVFPFEARRTYAVRVIADVPSRTYSVYVQDPDTGGVVQLARRYAFRPAPAGEASLDTLAASAGGPAGQLVVCDARGAAPGAVVYSREGSYAVAPLPEEQVIASDGVGMTWKLGPAGQVLGQVARGGEVAADAAGNVYVARAAGGQLALHALTPQLAPRWNCIEPVDPAVAVQAIAADAEGVSIVLGTAQGVAAIRRYPAAGGAGVQVHAGAAHAALARDGFAVAQTWPGGVAVSLHERGGAVRWVRSFASTVRVDVMTLGLEGSVVFGGHFEQAIAFGGPTLEPVYGNGVDVNSFVVGLARADGAHVFTRRIPTTRLTGADASGARLVIAGETWVMPIFPHLWQLDAAGKLLPGEPYVGFEEQWGRSGRVVVGSSDRIYWERLMSWPSFLSTAFPYLLVIEP